MTGPFGAPGVRDDARQHPDAGKGQTKGTEAPKVNRPTSLAGAVAEAIQARQANPEAYRASQDQRAQQYRDALAQHFRESNERVQRLTPEPQPTDRTHPFRGGTA